MMESSEVPDEVFKELCVESAGNMQPVTFIAPGDLTDDERAVVPQVWLNALALPGPDGVKLMIDEWERVLPGRLPSTTARFRAAGTDLILGRRLGIPVLIYLLTGHFGDSQYCPWVATPPQPRSAIPEHLTRLPSDILAFHTDLHDELDSPLMGGMQPFSLMDIVDTYYDPSWPFELWGGDGSKKTGLLGTDGQPDWTQVVLVHNDRGSTRMCATLSDDPNSTTGWWWFEGSMERLPDIWSALDRQLERGAHDWNYGD